MRVITLFLVTTLAFGLVGSAQGGTGVPIELISVPPEGETIESAVHSDISANGRWVGFSSSGDTWLHDAWSGTTERISVAHDGGPDNGDSEGVQISANGRYVAYTSSSTNVFEDKPPQTELYHKYWLFLRDTWEDETSRYGHSAAFGRELSGDGHWIVDDYHLLSLETRRRSSLPKKLGAILDVDISYEGRFLALITRKRLVQQDTNTLIDVYIYDRKLDKAELVSLASDETVGNRSSWSPHISASGRYVAFTSSADNLVPRDDNGQRDAFVRDRKLGTTTGLTIDRVDGTFSDLVSAEDISADGSAVAVFTFGDDLIEGKNTKTYLVRRKTGRIRPVPRRACGTSGTSAGQSPSLSRDGRFVSFHSDDPLTTDDDDGEDFDVFLRDMSARC